jgi:hypothetical protein
MLNSTTDPRRANSRAFHDSSRRRKNLDTECLHSIYLGRCVFALRTLAPGAAVCANHGAIRQRASCIRRVGGTVSHQYQLRSGSQRQRVDFRPGWTTRHIESAGAGGRNSALGGARRSYAGLGCDVQVVRRAVRRTLGTSPSPLFGFCIVHPDTCTHRGGCRFHWSLSNPSVDVSR